MASRNPEGRFGCSDHFPPRPSTATFITLDYQMTHSLWHHMQISGRDITDHAALNFSPIKIPFSTFTNGFTTKHVSLVFLLSLFSSQSLLPTCNLHSPVSRIWAAPRSLEHDFCWRSHNLKRQKKILRGQFGDCIVGMSSWNRRLTEIFRFQEHISTLPGYDFKNIFMYVQKYQSIRHSMTECMLTSHSAVDNRFRGKSLFSCTDRSGSKKKGKFGFTFQKEVLRASFCGSRCQMSRSRRAIRKRKLFHSLIFNKMFSLKFSVFLSVSIYFVTWTREKEEKELIRTSKLYSDREMVVGKPKAGWADVLVHSDFLFNTRSVANFSIIIVIVGFVSPFATLRKVLSSI